MGSWKGRRNKYVQFVRVLYCKPTNGKQLPAFLLEALPGTEPRPQRWEARVLPLCHCGSLYGVLKVMFKLQTHIVEVIEFYICQYCKCYLHENEVCKNNLKWSLDQLLIEYTWIHLLTNPSTLIVTERFSFA